MENLNKFSLGRTCSLIAKVIMEQPRVFLMRLLLLFGTTAIGAVCLGFANTYTYRNEWSVIDSNIGIEFGYFVFMLFILGIVYTSLAFNEAKNKPGRISLLMLPSRNFEKYIARFIVYVPLFIVLFIIAIFAADALRVLSLSIYYPEYADKVQFISFRDIFCRDSSVVLAMFLITQSFYWLGAILWPSNSLIKTFAAVSIISTVISLFWAFFYLIIIDGVDICRVPFFLNHDFDELHVLWCVSALVCLINYSIAYLRLKETDVIQRLL